MRALDPRAKLLGLAAVTLVAVTAPRGAWGVLAACAAVLGAYAVAARVRAGQAWCRWRVVLPLVLPVVVLVPLVRTGGAAHAVGPFTVHEEGLAVAAAVASKAAIGTLSAVLLGATTTFPEVLRALEALRMPRVLVLIAAVTYRYGFVVAGEAARMRAAMTARGFRPRTALDVGALGRMAGALFLRAHARGERVHLAMLARGYRGTLPGAAPARLAWSDVAFVALVLLALVPLRIAA